MSRPVPAEHMLHPAVLCAVGVLALNEHLLKDTMPGLLTGKLSDLAGLVVFPLALAGLWETACALAGRPPGTGRRHVLLSCIAVGLGFAAVNLSPALGRAFAAGFGAIQWPFHAIGSWLAGERPGGLVPISHTPDPTDLLVLPVLMLARRVASAPTDHAAL